MSKTEKKVRMLAQIRGVIVVKSNLPTDWLFDWPIHLYFPVSPIAVEERSYKSWTSALTALVRVYGWEQ